MARLLFQDGSSTTDIDRIGGVLGALGIRLDRLPVGDDPTLTALLAEDVLDDDEKETVLKGLDHWFERLKARDGYASRDLIVLHPGVPNLDGLLAKFTPAHTHADDEVRYIVDGEGVFGFTLPDGAQVELTVHPEEFINVPAGTEHWFHLTDARRIKAVRYFIGTAGWVPEYTGTKIAFG